MFIKEENNNDNFINEFKSRCYSVFSYMDDLDSLDSGLSELWSDGFMEDYNLDKLNDSSKDMIIKTLESCFVNMANVVDSLVGIKTILDSTRE